MGLNFDDDDYVEYNNERFDHLMKAHENVSYEKSFERRDEDASSADESDESEST